MITSLVLAIQLAVSIPSFAMTDPWFGEDKLQHFFTTFVVSSVAASSARLFGVGARSSLWVGVGTASTAGLFKEIADSRDGRLFSSKDLLWDFGGIAASAALLDSAR